MIDLTALSIGFACSCVAVCAFAVAIRMISERRCRTVDNPVTRCGEGLRPFVEACDPKRIEKMGRELYERAKTKPDSNLAERLYAARADEDSLFDSVNEILGCNTHDCLNPGFKFAAHDTFWDDYDNSVEVVLDAERGPITDEQALRILGLGFGQIYATRGDEMENISPAYSAPGIPIPGQLWRHKYDKSYTRTGDEDNQWRAKCNVLKAQLDAATPTLDRVK